MAEPYYTSDTVTVHHGDCLDVLAELADASVDAVCTDPPYELAFMGRTWDRTGIAYNVGLWRHCLRVLKPGGHMLAFGGTRTWHRLTCAVEDAGFEIRDSIAWLYGSGFPKSLDVSKAIDKAAGAEREVVGVNQYAARRPGDGSSDVWDNQDPGLGGAGSAIITAPATDDARRWQGWGTALKPAFEPIVVARKPLAGTVAANVLTHGTGALNVDGCRIEHASAADLAESQGKNRHADFGSGPRDNRVYGADNRDRGESGNYDGSQGRWPANVVLDEHQAAALDQQSGEQRDGFHVGRNRDPAEISNEIYGARGKDGRDIGYGGSGGASRFYYTAKADTAERIRIPVRITKSDPSDTYDYDWVSHPTVKPLDLMRWLVRLVTPPGGLVLDPFAGSGTTAEACILERFRCIAIEREAEYLPMITQRINRRRDPAAYVAASGEDPGLFGLFEEDA